jgi:hypothetical protein
MAIANRTTCKVLCFILVAAVLAAAGCAAGDERFTPEESAGFWYGLWHGIIVVVAFIISLFADTVQIYELNNNGGWYNLGYVLGIVICGGGTFRAHRRKKHRKPKDADWEEIGAKVEEKVLQKLKEFVESKESEAEEVTDEEVEKEAPKTRSEKDAEWEEIGRKIEKKIKRKLKKWADEP